MTLLRDPSPSSIAALAMCLGHPSRVLRTESLIKLLECPSLTKLSTSLRQSLYVMALSEEESLNIGRFNFFGLPPGPRRCSHLRLRLAKRWSQRSHRSRSVTVV